MRIRSIKPEFWRSDDTDQLDWHARLVFIGLWSYVDDNGVGLYKLPSVVGDLFAHDFLRDPNETLRRVSESLNALENRQMICRYEVDGKAYVYVCNWAKHQRVSNPNKPRYPDPTSANVEPHESLTRSYVDPHESLGTGTGEQGNRGTEKKNAHEDTEAFTSFWDEYPKKVSKGQARTAFTRALSKASLEDIIDGVRRYRNNPDRVDKFTKNAATWLNGECWNDETPASSVSSDGMRAKGLWQGD